MKGKAEASDAMGPGKGAGAEGGCGTRGGAIWHRISGIWRLTSGKNCWLGLATTRSPTVRTAVPWARRGFTAEFGMGSGGAPAL